MLRKWHRLFTKGKIAQASNKTTFVLGFLDDTEDLEKVSEAETSKDQSESATSENNTCTCTCRKYQRNEMNLRLDNWKHRLGFESARAALCECATCTRQTIRSKTFANSKKMFGKRVITRTRYR